MIFHEGDTVMHWTYGLGTILRLEEQDLAGVKGLYYAVQIGNMIVWVPADDQLENRLRSPMLKAKFTRSLAILSGPSEALPADHHERKLLLLEWLRDGRVESLCRVIRSLHAHQKARPLNDNDQALLRRAQNALIGEWSFALSLTAAQAESELNRLLTVSEG